MNVCLTKTPPVIFPVQHDHATYNLCCVIRKIIQVVNLSNPVVLSYNFFEVGGLCDFFNELIHSF